MTSLVCDSTHFNHTIDKVAKWMATSDSQVCLFADDTSVSILSSVTQSTNSDSEQERQVLINELKRDAVTRINSLFCSTANQENNHNESKKKLAQNPAVTLDTGSSSSDTSLNRNQNNRHGASESDHRRKSHGDTRNRRQSQPSNSHSTVQRKDSGDGSGGGGFKEDKYLERIVDRATQEIRSAIYKLRAENKLPEKCHLKMRLSIKPHRSSADNSSPKDSPKEQHRRQRSGGDDDRLCRTSTGHHKTKEQGGSEKSEARSDREKRRISAAASRHDHREHKKDRRKY